jgi:hypothetical protein
MTFADILLCLKDFDEHRMQVMCTDCDRPFDVVKSIEITVEKSDQ